MTFLDQSILYIFKTFLFVCFFFPVQNWKYAKVKYKSKMAQVKLTLLWHHSGPELFISVNQDLIIFP